MHGRYISYRGTHLVEREHKSYVLVSSMQQDIAEPARGVLYSRMSKTLMQGHVFRLLNNGLNKTMQASSVSKLTKLVLTNFREKRCHRGQL